MKRKTIVEIIAALFILLFVYTAMSKLNNPDGFKWALKKSPLISPYTEMIAWVLPVVELAVSVLLFIPGTRRAGLYSAVGMMAVFTIYIGYMLVFTPKLPCSCGGVLQQMSWKQHLFFNTGFTLLGVLGLWLERPAQEKGENIAVRQALS